MAATASHLTPSQARRAALRQRVAQLEAENATLQQRLAALEERLAAPAPTAGHAVARGLADTMADIRAIGDTVQAQTEATLQMAARQQARLGEEMQALRSEAARLVQWLDEAAAGVQGFASQAEVRVATLLRETYQQQAHLTQQAEQLAAPAPPARPLAERRRAAYSLRAQARAEAARLTEAAQRARDALGADAKLLRRSTHHLRTALVHLNQRAETLCHLARAGGEEAQAVAPQAAEWLRELLTAPRPAWAVAVATTAGQAAIPLALPLRERARGRSVAKGARPALPRGSWRLAMVPLVALLLSSSSPAARSALAPTRRVGGKATPEQAIARLTMRHALRDLRAAFHVTHPARLAQYLRAAREATRAPAAPRRAQPVPAIAPAARRLAPAELDAAPALAALPSAADHAGAAATVEAAEIPAPVAPRPAIVPTIAPAPFAPGSYVVERGDSLWVLARRWGLRVETLLWANPDLSADPNTLYRGQTLVVPPTDGIVHTVQTDDTLPAIAARYSVPVEAIVAFAPNGLGHGDAPLAAGQPLMVPGGALPAHALVAAACEAATVAPDGAPFCWPARGRISQAARAGHMALDIALPSGSPVVAAADGQALLAGWDASGYGFLVLLDHGNGFRTLYAHLSTLHIAPGATVRRGDLIANSGSSGNSTGPHLHFEIRLHNAQQNPAEWLR